MAGEWEATVFETILVPVDVTDAAFSEQILFHVLRLLERESCRVELFSVVMPLGDDPGEGRSQRLDAASRHLQGLVDKMSGERAQAGFYVQIGDPAHAILQRISASRPSLVAMATHGRSGPARWIRGSVAERVLRESESPLLLCTPPNDIGDAKGSLEFRRILVPLDGSEAGAQILPLASAFAEKHDSTLVLCRVGYPAYAAVSGAAGGLPVLEKSDLEASLAHYAERLTVEGRKVETYVSLGDPAAEILDAVDNAEIDLVAMTTHGHTGIDRWLFGSVAENVLRHCAAPLLIHRVKKVWISPEDRKA